MSIVILDSSVESFLRIVVDESHSYTKKDLEGFMSLLSKVSNICKNKVPLDESSISNMHRGRNGIQHEGLILDRELAGKFFVACEELFVNLSDKILHVKWNNVSLSMLIEDKEVAKLYEQAEKSFANNDFRNAANKVIIAFELAKANRQAEQFGSGITLNRDAVHKEFRDQTNAYDASKELIKYLDKIYSEVEVLKLGLDYKKWRDYRVVLGTLNPDKTFVKSILHNKTFTQDNQSDHETNKQVLEVDDFSGSLTSGYDVNSETEADDLFGGEAMLCDMSDEQIKIWLEATMPFAMQSIIYWQESQKLTFFSSRFDF